MSPNHEGVHIYEFGNHGAVLVMAEVNQATNMVIYSLDEGFLAGGFMKFLCFLVIIVCCCVLSLLLCFKSVVF